VLLAYDASSQQTAFPSPDVASYLFGRLAGKKCGDGSLRVKLLILTSALCSRSGFCAYPPSVFHFDKQTPNQVPPRPRPPPLLRAVPTCSRRLGRSPYTPCCFAKCRPSHIGAESKFLRQFSNPVSTHGILGSQEWLVFSGTFPRFSSPLASVHLPVVQESSPPQQDPVEVWPLSFWPPSTTGFAPLPETFIVFSPFVNPVKHTHLLAPFFGGFLDPPA